jgi:hypothetical protein
MKTIACGAKEKKECLRIYIKMKTIQITDETYEFLKDLAGKLKTQDNRATANPRYYAIREKEKIYGMEDGYDDDYVYVRDDNEWECDTLKEAFGCECELAEIEKQDGETAIDAVRREWTNHKNDFSSRIKGTYSKIKPDDCDEEILLESLGWRKVGIRHTEKFSNCFLTEAAANEHIRINGHNLNSPDTFLFHAYRNKELDMVIKAILEIGESNE